MTRILVTSRPLRTELEERVITAALIWQEASSVAAMEQACRNLTRAIRLLRIERGEK